MTAAGPLAQREALTEVDDMALHEFALYLGTMTMKCWAAANDLGWSSLRTCLGADAPDGYGPPVKDHSLTDAICVALIRDDVAEANRLAPGLQLVVQQWAKESYV